MLKKYYFCSSKKNGNMSLKSITIVLFFTFSYLTSNATGCQSDNISITELNNNTPVLSSLSIVYGWIRNPKNDKWMTKENEIKGIDKFVNYYILPLEFDTEKYIAIVKEQKDLLFDIYIINYNAYSKVVYMREEDALIKFPILKYSQIKLQKGKSISIESLGLNNLSDLLDNPNGYFIFQYKFFSDSTVKFLFYIEHCSSDNCEIKGLDTKEENKEWYNYIGTNQLYNNFFYKTTIKYFTEFIYSPLN